MMLMTEKEEDMNSVQLKHIRFRKSISQIALAIRSGVKASRISRFECGYLELTPYELMQVAAVLNQIEDKDKRGFWSRHESEKGGV